MCKRCERERCEQYYYQCYECNLRLNAKEAAKTHAKKHIAEGSKSRVRIVCAKCFRTYNKLPAFYGKNKTSTVTHTHYLKT